MIRVKYQSFVWTFLQNKSVSSFAEIEQFGAGRNDAVFELLCYFS